MAAFGDVVGTELRGKKAPAADTNSIYTRTFSFVIPASSTVAAGTITGIKLPPGTLVLGGCVVPSQSLGSTTLAFSCGTSTVVFSAAATYTAAAGLAAPASAAAMLAVPPTATADDTVVCTTAAATSPSSATTVKVTLVCASVGQASADYSTFTV